MGINVKENGGGNYEPVPEGMHQGICYAVYDLGTQFNEKFGKSIHKVLIMWEIPEERIDIERNGETINLPRAISKEYTASLHEKANLRKQLEGWRGRAFTPEELKGFDLTKLLSVNCMLQVIHTTKNDKTYANVQTIVPLMKGMAKKAPENPTKYFSFEDGTTIPEGTPEWVVKKIEAAEEWNTDPQSPVDQGSEPPWPEDDQIPF